MQVILRLAHLADALAFRNYLQPPSGLPHHARVAHAVLRGAADVRRRVSGGCLPQDEGQPKKQTAADLPGLQQRQPLRIRPSRTQPAALRRGVEQLLERLLEVPRREEVQVLRPREEEVSAVEERGVLPQDEAQA